MHTDEHGFTGLLEKELTEKIIGACLDVSNELGTGSWRASPRRRCSSPGSGALRERGLKAEAQAPLTVHFRGCVVGVFYVDVLVEGRVVLERKAVKTLAGEHEAQLINCLKATGIKAGLLVNFGKPRLEWKRMVY